MSKLKTTTQNLKTDLKIRCYYFSIKVIKFLETLPEKKIYWVIVDQLLRAVTSIGANMIEAQAASSRRDFIKFYEIALKSANESKFWLGLLRDSKKADGEKTNKILQETIELANILGSSILTLRGKRKL